MLSTMQKMIIDGEHVIVDDKLIGFTIHSKPSTNVEYFGSSSNSEVFVQFKSGSSYIYTGVSSELISQMERASSIGGFIAEMIYKPKLYPSTKHGRLVTSEKDEVKTDQDGFITDAFGNAIW